MNVLDSFRLDGQVVVITGGGGLLGPVHGLAVAEAGGVPVLWDVNPGAVEAAASEVRRATGTACEAQCVDITSQEQVAGALEALLARLGRVDGLVNNAARNPQVGSAQPAWSRLENYPLDAWEADLAVGLTGAMLCSRVLGEAMAARGGGVIVNISSDLGVIAPDQRLYRQPGLPEDQQPAKPVSYSVVKHGLIGLTKYLATYYADRGVRANALAPGGVEAGQPEEFLQRITSLIPLGRMARRDEYKAAVVFLLSQASAYMTGSVICIDGGRTCW